MQSPFLLSLAGAALPEGKNPAGRTYFSSIGPAESSRWPGFLTSTALHVLALLLLPPVSNTLTRHYTRELDVRQQRLVRTLRIRIPEELYLAARGAAGRPSAPQQKHPGVFYVSPAEAARLAASGPRSRPRVNPRATPLRRGARRATARRRFQLPPLPRHSDRVQTILQPQFAPDMLPALATNLPEVFFWTPQTSLPHFVKPFVLPGHVVPPTQPRLLDSEPMLASVAAPPAPLSIQPLPELVRTAHLLVPPPSLPIRTAAGERNTATQAADPTRGDPATVLSLSTNPPPLREFLAVPPGNVVGRQPDAAGGGPLTNEAAGGEEARRGSAKAVAAALPETNPPASVEPAPEPIPAPPPAAAPPKPATALPAAKPAEPAPSAVLAAAAATRIVHPAGGVFDVVVQSGGLEGFTESAGVLSGRPVYSVFVRAGAAKDWILQYCIPAEDEQAAAQAGAVVRLGNPSPLEPPYPLVTTRPPLRPRPGGYVMVHGFVTPAGRFQSLRVLGKTGPQDAELVLGVLDQWEFRPASRDAKPLRVEILLAIPAE
jgi:hypothetical protein